jgi:DNA-binding transcriptional MocR family regulator
MTQWLDRRPSECGRLGKLLGQIAASEMASSRLNWLSANRQNHSKIKHQISVSRCHSEKRLQNMLREWLTFGLAPEQEDRYRNRYRHGADYPMEPCG